METGRMSRPRAYSWLALAAAVGAFAVTSAGGCNDAELIQPPACAGACTCEGDPSQPTCRAFDGPGGDSVDAADADGSDAGADGALDGSIDADADAANDGADATD